MSVIDDLDREILCGEQDFFGCLRGKKRSGSRRFLQARTSFKISFFPPAGTNHAKIANRPTDSHVQAGVFRHVNERSRVHILLCQVSCQLYVLQKQICSGH